jgi:hypothetical protein
MDNVQNCDSHIKYPYIRNCGCKAQDYVLDRTVTYDVV